jgi:hypothetical protein
MTDKFHEIKFWNEKSSRVTKGEYINIEAIQEWIDSMKTKKPVLSVQIAENELLEELETFLYDKK